MAQEDYSIIPVDLTIYNNTGASKMFQFYKTNFEVKLETGSNIKVRATSSLELSYYKDLVIKDYTIIEDGCVVTFNLNYEGAPTASTSTVIEGQPVAEPAEPTRTGYTFVSWNTWDDENEDETIDEAELEEFDFDDAIQENITLYATWLINEYTITFESNGGDPVSPITEDYGTAVSEPEDLVLEGYTFLGWFTDDESFEDEFEFTTMPAQNITLYAGWEANEYTITFVSNGGSAVTAIVQDYLTEVTEPTEPTRTGYTFLGWFTDDGIFTEEYVFDTMPAEDITLYASWEINEYTVLFNYNYTGATEPFSTVLVDYNDTVIEPIVNPEHGTYEFGGWYENALGTGDAFNFTTPITADKTLYAIWGNEVNLNYNYVGAEEPFESQFVLEGAKAVEPTADPTQVGYAFTGWFEETGATIPFDFNVVVTIPTEIYAGWAPTSIVTFESNGGSPVDSQEVVDGELATEPTAPTRAEYNFIGWFTDDGIFTEEFIFTTPIVADIILYAKWASV